MALQQVGQALAAARIHHRHAVGLRQQRAQPQAALRVGMQAQHRKRVGVARMHQRMHFLVTQHRRGFSQGHHAGTVRLKRPWYGEAQGQAEGPQGWRANDE